VDALLAAIGHEDLGIRSSALKALNRLRESSPDLHFENGFVTERIMAEARRYYELLAALAPFQGEQARLLARSLDDRLKATLERLFRLLGLRYPPKEIYNVYRAVSRDNAEEHTAAIEFLDATLDRSLKRILIPLLDAPETRLERGRELFGVEPLTAEEAIRELIHLHDPWLTPCAMAAAAELKLRSLAPEIAKAAGSSEGEMSEVAKSAEAALAA
jgi:AAA family ATP:ADP antiporter